MDLNATEALDNAVDAHKEIESAAQHQKGTGKCIIWSVLIVGTVIAVIITIFVVKLVKK